MSKPLRALLIPIYSEAVIAIMALQATSPCYDSVFAKPLVCFAQDGVMCGLEGQAVLRAFEMKKRLHSQDIFSVAEHRVESA
jgi:hypothetical protein